MELQVYKGEQDQKHLPVPSGIIRPKLIRIIPSPVLNRLVNYNKKRARKGSVVDLKV